RRGSAGRVRSAAGRQGPPGHQRPPGLDHFNKQYEKERPSGRSFAWHLPRRANYRAMVLSPRSWPWVSTVARTAVGDGAGGGQPTTMAPPMSAPVHASPTTSPASTGVVT